MIGSQVPLEDRYGTHRLELIQELERRYGSSPQQRRLRYLRKKYAWMIVIGSARVLKRLIDILASGAALIALFPFFLLIALAIKLTDRGPVLFWQTRVGQWGREFPFPKFRSMVTNAETLKTSLLAESHHGESITFKMKRDPRVTWIGRILRKLSLDELPQLWSVFIGDMSLVGPRPPVPREVAQYTLSDRRRLDVVPGLTCIWQVSGRGDIPFAQQVELDVDYIESQSLWLDVKLLLRTVPAVLLGKGAY
jgi:lipopolysaccharide/colanic/teichoic acid biosynthesis glycosyltransferase